MMREDGPDRPNGNLHAETIDRIDAAEKAAMADIFLCADGFADPADVAHRWFGNALMLVCRPHPIPPLQRVFGLSSGTPGWQDVLDDVLVEYERRGIAVAPIQVNTTDLMLTQAIAARGLTFTASRAKFLRPAIPPARIEVAYPIRELIPADAAPFDALLATAFKMPIELAGWFATIVGRPGWRCFGALDGDRVVATGAIFLHAGCAWFGAGATLPQYRGNSLQKGLIAARIEAAIEDGADLLTGETSISPDGTTNPSFLNFRRAGFGIAYERRIFSTRKEQ